MKITGEGGEVKLTLMGYNEGRSRKVLAKHRFLVVRTVVNSGSFQPAHVTVDVMMSEEEP